MSYYRRSRPKPFTKEWFLGILGVILCFGTLSLLAESFSSWKNNPERQARLKREMNERVRIKMKHLLQ